MTAEAGLSSRLWCRFASQITRFSRKRSLVLCLVFTCTLTVCCGQSSGGYLLTFIVSDEFAETLKLVDRTSHYALTGSVFARDRYAIRDALSALEDSAGNFYINDKPTGAVVGQQPFGGSRQSGTNDKAGSALNLLRWTQPRTIKETFVPPKDFSYPYMQE
jgi:1-pyrroline-5-carboxylate dehydrogenase